MACNCGCSGSNAHQTAYYCENCNVVFGLPTDLPNGYTLVQMGSSERKGAPLVAKNVRFAPCGCLPQFIYELLVVPKPNTIDRENCPPSIAAVPTPTPCCTPPEPIVPIVPTVPEPVTPPPPGPCDCVTLPGTRATDRVYYRYPWPELF